MRLDRSIPGWKAALLLAVAVLVAGACATGGSQEDEEGPSVAVRVQNNLVTPSTVSVYVRDDDGTSELLGTVDPDETQTFSFRPALTGGEFGYRLVAERADGEDIVSRRISVTGEAIVAWDLDTNSVNVIG